MPPDEGPAAQERRAQVAVDLGAPLVVRQLGDRAQHLGARPAGQAGVVDQHLDVAELVGIASARAPTSASSVRSATKPVTPSSRRASWIRRVVDTIATRAPQVARRPRGRRVPDAVRAAGAGDQRNLAVQPQGDRASSGSSIRIVDARSQVGERFPRRKWTRRGGPGGRSAGRVASRPDGRSS
jgi:hypothetical protein